MHARTALFVFPFLGAAALAVPALVQADAPAPPAKPYTLTVARVSAAKGQPATAHVVIHPAKGYHMNKEFPTSLHLHPPKGVTAQKDKLTKADAAITEQEQTFDVVLTSTEAGKLKVPGDLKFAVCTETSCDPQRSQVTIEMDVK